MRSLRRRVTSPVPGVGMERECHVSAAITCTHSVMPDDMTTCDNMIIAGISETCDKMTDDMT